MTVDVLNYNYLTATAFQESSTDYNQHINGIDICVKIFCLNQEDAEKIKLFYRDFWKRNGWRNHE